MEKRITCAILYFLLLLLALPIPLMELHLTQRAFEIFRPYYKGNDGLYYALLLPANILVLRNMGDMSLIFPVGILGTYISTFWLELGRKLETICFIAMGLCLFSTLYALLAMLNLFAYAAK